MEQTALFPFAQFASSGLEKPLLLSYTEKEHETGRMARHEEDRGRNHGESRMPDSGVWKHSCASKQAERGPLSVTRSGILRSRSPVPLRRLLFFPFSPSFGTTVRISRHLGSLPEFLASRSSPFSPVDEPSPASPGSCGKRPGGFHAIS